MSLKEFDAASGTAAPDATPIAATLVTFDRIPLAKIVASRTNPRLTFDEAKLQELAASIAGLGVMQPILVRPLPGDRVDETSGRKRGERPEYEIVSGERRFRASKLAGVPDIPAMIRAMSDQQVLEAQLVENLQRDDLHPLEEAEGYERLCKATGITKEQIGEKIGKSRSYVYNRLKLLTLGEESRKAFYEGKLDSSRAEMLATVADPKLQLKALKEFVTVDYHGKPMSVRQCATWLEQNILLKIKDAPFDTKDDMLLATNCPPNLDGTKACTSCPKRTHAHRDLFAAFDGPDMCIDPVCFHAKEAAHFSAIKAEAEAKGMEVIIGKDAKKLRPHSYHSEIKGYTRLDAKVDDGSGTEVSVSKLLGKDAPTPILFVDPHTHTKVKVLPNDVVGKALKEKGVVKETRADQERKQKAERERAELKEKIERDYERRAFTLVNDQLRAGGVNAFSAGVLRIHLERLVDDDDGYGSAERDEMLLDAWGLPRSTKKESWEQARENGATVERHVKAAPDGALGVMLLQVLLVGEVGTGDDWRRDKLGGLQLLAQLAGEVGVDLAAVKSEVQAEHKAAAKAAKQPARPPGATLEAAPQGSNARDGEAGSAPASRGGRRRKLSAQEATQGIAAAMQSDEGARDDAGAGDDGAQLTIEEAAQSGGASAPQSEGEPAGVTGELTVESLQPLMDKLQAAIDAEDAEWDRKKVKQANRKGGINHNELHFLRSAQVDLQSGDRDEAIEQLRDMVGLGVGPSDWAAFIRQDLLTLLHATVGDAIQPGLQVRIREHPTTNALRGKAGKTVTVHSVDNNALQVRFSDNGKTIEILRHDVERAEAADA